MSSENSKGGDPEVTMWTWKVGVDGMRTATKHEDLTDEEREQVRDGLRRERLPFSSSVHQTPSAWKDWIEHHSPHEIALLVVEKDALLVALGNAHRYLEERLQHARRERETLERDLQLVEKKLTAATFNNVQLEKAADEWQGFYAELEKKYKLECAKKNPCGEQANEPVPAQSSAQPSNPPEVADALPKPRVESKKTRVGAKIRKAWNKE